MKRVLLIMLALLMMTALCACGEQKQLQCDGCGTMVSVNADSDMTDEWLIYCGECEKELQPEIDAILDAPVL